VNANVARRAVLVARVGKVVPRRLNLDAVCLSTEIIRAVVALQAKREDDWAL
jgi:hypothetical protein